MGVETKLRFCLATSCTTNINSSLNNIRPLAGTILRDLSLNEILKVVLDHGTIIKSLVICAIQLAGGFLLKMPKYFEVM